MKNRRLIAYAALLVLAGVVILYLFSGRYRYIENPEIPGRSLPVASISGLLPDPGYVPLINYLGFSLAFDNHSKQSVWVAYHLSPEEVQTAHAERTDRFRKDTIPGLNTANNSDYLRSGYDKGHLAPAADMAWSRIAMDESFFFSNISPQTPSLNRGIWRTLEGQVRQWAVQKGGVYIITGPSFTSSPDSIGSLPIPSCFYKALLIYQKEHQAAIGFLFPNEKVVKGRLLDFAVPVDSIESLIQMDLFDKLPDRIEKRIEKSFDVVYWFGQDH